jgi:hypothetical protein
VPDLCNFIVDMIIGMTVFFFLAVCNAWTKNHLVSRLRFVIIDSTGVHLIPERWRDSCEMKWRWYSDGHRITTFI